MNARAARDEPDTDVQRVEIIGHRGAPREARENTLTSFERALAQGADAIELDVHATSDGVVVVHHDAVFALDAHAGIAGRPIASMTWEELERIQHSDRGRAPRLAEVLELVGDRAVAYVEVKGAGIEAAVVRCIEASPAECAVHAFDHRVVVRIRTLAPGIRTGILLEARLVDPAGALREAGATDFWQQWKMIDEDLVSAVESAGGRVIAWTVNEIPVADALVRMGVRSLCTDLPGEMRKAWVRTT